MALTRDLRALICRVLTGVLLFAQMALSAYACPRSTNSEGSATAVEHMAPASHTAAGPEHVGCSDMALDEDFSNLCVEHCRLGQQSADHVQSPSIAAAILVPLYMLPMTIDASSPPPTVDARPAPPPPPHTILHCCFRT